MIKRKIYPKRNWTALLRRADIVARARAIKQKQSVANALKGYTIIIGKVGKAYIKSSNGRFAGSRSTK